MGFLSRAVSEQKSYGTIDLFRELYSGGRVSATGRTVNVKSALEVSTVVACVRVIGEGIAQVPLKLIRESADGKTRLPAKDHPLYEVLAYRPNNYQTSFEFRETLAWHVVLTGNFFAFKNVVFGKIKELIPFEPGNVVVTRADNGTLTYEVTAQSGAKQIFPAEAIWHVRGPSWNTWMGLEAVQLAREAIGLAMATEEQHARMHKNGVKSSGVYSVDGTLNPEQFKNLRAWIEREMAGSENAGKAMLLDRNAKWLNTSMSGVDAQHLETRKHQISEICRFFRVSPIMVYGDDKLATYAGSTANFLSHLIHTLAPWYTRLEQSIDANLLTEKDRKAGLYSQFVEEGMLRGDSAATSEFLTKLTTNGIMTRNEARAKLDLNPLDGLDEPLTPANMIIGTEMPEPPAPADTSVQDAQDAHQNEQVAKAISDICEVKTLVNMALLAPKTPVLPANTEVKTGDTHIHLPENLVKIYNEATKQEPAQVTVNMPEVQPPVINVAPAEIKVDVAAPNVSFEAVMPTPNVIVSLPTRKTETSVTRDRDGNILTATQIEKDA